MLGATAPLMVGNPPSSSTLAQVEDLGQFTKHQSNTVLQITYDTQITAPSGDYCFVQPRVDGLNDEGGSDPATGTGSEAGEYNGSTAPTRHRSGWYTRKPL